MITTAIPLLSYIFIVVRFDIPPVVVIVWSPEIKCVVLKLLIFHRGALKYLCRFCCFATANPCESTLHYLGDTFLPVTLMLARPLHWFVCFIPCICKLGWIISIEHIIIRTCQYTWMSTSAQVVISENVNLQSQISL